MMGLDPVLRSDLISVARGFVNAPLAYTFTERERMALRPFFSNSDRKVYIMSGLPESIAATLLAMYSRLKNRRGLRGHYLDLMVPVLMSADSDVVVPWKEMQKRNREMGLLTLDAICDKVPGAQADFERYLTNAPNPDYWTRLATSPRIKDFKGEHIDTYGHDSIARPTVIRACVEDISIQAAKTMEWTWPGTAWIELSTRYVDFSGKSRYPVEQELGLIDATVARMAVECMDASVDEYRRLIGDKFDGPFPSFLRERWAGIVPDKDLASGVIGESCDVLGNLLPCATLTQLGAGVTGEALGPLIRNLYLDGTPENIALAEFLIEEAERAGHGYFLRHYVPTEWQVGTWKYLPNRAIVGFNADDPVLTGVRIAMGMGMGSMADVLSHLSGLKRMEHDRLPNAFNLATAMSFGVMSYRGWRDTQRQSLSTHARGRVTPLLGFYRYPKPSPSDLDLTFSRIHSINEDLYMAMCAARIPEELMEYPMSMGNLVPYQMTSSLKQAEFCNWQRSKWGVNDEVRVQFILTEARLRQHYAWWEKVSRADLTPHYVFARGKQPVVLPA